KAGDAGGRADREKADRHGVTYREDGVGRKTGEAAGEGHGGAGGAAAQDDRAAARGEREGEAAIAALDLLGHHDLALGLIGEGATRLALTRADGRDTARAAGHIGTAQGSARREAGVGRKTGEAAGEGHGGAGGAAAQDDRAAARGEREGEAAIAALDLLGHHDLALGLIGEGATGIDLTRAHDRDTAHGAE